MNLSSSLQMPPAPLTSNSPNTAVPQGTRSGVGTSTHGNSGFDFAQVMAKQIARIASQDRQNLAADTRTTTAPESHREEHRAAENPKDTSRESRADDTQSRDARDEASEKTSRSTAKRKSVKHEPADVDALLNGLMQGQTATAAPTLAGLAAVAPARDSSQSTAAAASDLNTLKSIPVNTADKPTPAPALQSLQLSPNTRILTAPQQAPTPESLLAFAQAMGLDPAAIESLMPKDTLSASPMGHAIASPLNSPATLGIQQGLPTALGAMPSADHMVALQLAAMNQSAQPNTQIASGAGLAAPASTLNAAMPGLTAADMASITQVQITVLPTAILSASAAQTTSTPSTQDMLSLMGASFNEQDVEALLNEFSNQADHENDAQQQSFSDGGDHPSLFAQSLNRSSTAANVSVQSASQSAPMGEIYDQLSDKMATEMAARMHKQLSDGQWKMKFALRPSNLGGVEIQLEMKDGQLNAAFQADNPLTRDLLQNSSQRLREALANFGINAGQVNVGQGGSNTSQNNSGNSGKQTQVRDNSSSQVNGTGNASGAANVLGKANASLLDLYA